MNTANRIGLQNATSDNWNDIALEAWLSVYAVKAVASTIKGAITSASFLKRIRTIHDVNMLGIIPPWTPSKAGPVGFPRVSNPFLYFLAVRGSGLTFLTARKPFNVTALAQLVS